MYKDPRVPITEDQIRKIYAQPNKDEQLYMRYKIHEEMMFFMERKSKGIFTWNDLPMVFLSKEEQKRVEGVSIDQMFNYLGNLEESKKNPEFKLERINP